MNCEDVMRQAEKYWMGDLSVHAEKEMDKHLDRCEKCTKMLDELVASEARFQVTPQEEAKISGWLRTTFTLDPKRERQGIKTIIANAQKTIPVWEPSLPVSPWPVPHPLKVSDPYPLKYAAADTDEIQARIGAEFEKRNPIPLSTYTGVLGYLNRNSALLLIQKEGKPTTELDGKKIVFYVIEASKTAETAKHRIEETIQNEVVVIDFTKLGLSIEDYAQVGFKLYIDESTLIEGTLGNVK